MMMWRQPHQHGSWAMWRGLWARGGSGPWAQRDRSRRLVSVSCRRGRAVAGEYDAIVVGGGHNALVAAAVLGRHGMRRVLVLEGRHVLGGAAVTEAGVGTLPKDVKVSRAASLVGLLRPNVVRELRLAERGLKLLHREPQMFNPPEQQAKGEMALALGFADAAQDAESIAEFDARDAERFAEFTAMMERAAGIVEPLMDDAPPDIRQSWRESVQGAMTMTRIARVLAKFAQRGTLATDMLTIYQLIASPASTVLDEWFHSEVLKTTLATHSTVGSRYAPSLPGSAFTLLHHAIGQDLDGRRGNWSYVEGGMGSLTTILASAAAEHGADVRCNTRVARILTEPMVTSASSLSPAAAVATSAGFSAIGSSPPTTTGAGDAGADGTRGGAIDESSGAPPRTAPHRVAGVETTDGRVFLAPVVLSNLDLHATMSTLLSEESRAALPERDLHQAQQQTDYDYSAIQVNIATSAVPQFAVSSTAFPVGDDGYGPHHNATAHLQRERSVVERAYEQCRVGVAPERPILHMTFPSALDKTLAPPGVHVCHLSSPAIPYELCSGTESGTWTSEATKDYVENTMFPIVERYCPGFSASVLGYDAVSPADLESIFGMTKGNMSQGAMPPHQMLWFRAAYAQPITGLYICGSAAHPPCITGAAGRNAARRVLRDLHRL